MEIYSHDPSHRLYHCNVLLQPYLLSFLDFPQLANLSLLSKEYYDRLKKDEISLGYWHAMCISLAGYYGLYLPKFIGNSRDYFFNEIWNLRHKWKLTENTTTQSFRIRIASRFRPGKLSTTRFALPLHQFLKVRASQATKNKQQVFVGEKIPAHYQDALLGTLMKEPVKLSDSGQILDRSVAVSCILRGGKDPFTGTKLTAESLIPMPELAQEIALFRTKQENIDISLAQEDVLELVEQVDPRLIEALVEAEQIKHASHRVDYEASYEERYGISLSQIQQLENHFQVPIGAPFPNQDLDDDTDDQPQTQQLPLPITQLSNSLQRDEDDFEQAILSGNANNSNSSNDSFGSRWRKVKSDNTARIIDINKQTATVTMNVPGVGVRPYHFNAVFPQLESQEKVYQKSARDVVVSAINGLNGCILCYGQTGSGKTHTMFGPDGTLHPPSNLSDEMSIELLDQISDTKSDHGIVLRSCAEILRAKKHFEFRNEISLTIQMQYVEIYNETVTDLISPTAVLQDHTSNVVTIRRATGELVGATMKTVHTIADIYDILHLGNLRKHFASTAMNDRSSRSHTILLVHLTQQQLSTQSMVKSLLYLVDLAGSERIKKSKVVGQQLTEAKAINSSLLVLGKVINRLSKSDLHVPYYESQLTTLLKSTFGGNCLTRIIVTCHSNDQAHGDEILNTLRFSEKCSMITNSTKVIATSVSQVLECLDRSIHDIHHQLESLKQRKKETLPSFKTLEIKLKELKSKRESIASMI